MAKLNLSQAAKAVGKNRVTLWRHINSGKLSSERGRDGNPLVDTSELLRVYGELKGAATQGKQQLQHNETPSYDELLSLVKELRSEQAEMKSIILNLQNRLELKPAPPTSKTALVATAEQDPEWPAEVSSMQDLMKRRELREKYGEDT
ncbi:hypothetical protein AAEI00_20435 [Shewanella algae]|uniref:hypothetical protein n=1 Tax=Shewanella algae TaxID=38313 RepID=UPI00313A958F